MKRRQFAKFCALLVSFTMIMTLVGCGKQATDAAATSADNTTKLNSMTLDEIIAEAKKVGKLDTVGMPDDWCNYGNLFNAIDSEYGLTHTDIDMSSSEQIALFKAEADSPTKDIGEVGQQNAQKVIDEGIVQAYKPTTWDSVPDWAKDTDGYWMIGYTGAVAIMTNTDKVGKITRAQLEEIAKGKIKDMNAANVDAAVRTLAGSARSMGVTVEGL